MLRIQANWCRIAVKAIDHYLLTHAAGGNIKCHGAKVTQVNTVLHSAPQTLELLIMVHLRDLQAHRVHSIVTLYTLPLPAKRFRSHCPLGPVALPPTVKAIRRGVLSEAVQITQSRLKQDRRAIGNHRKRQIIITDHAVIQLRGRLACGCMWHN